MLQISVDNPVRGSVNWKVVGTNVAADALAHVASSGLKGGVIVFVGEDFVRMWTSALAHCQKRFHGKREVYKREPSGGIGAFTPDSFPVFDTFRQNAYVIADANHGYKMIGIGQLVADELLGQRRELLEPFRFDRYTTGKLHPTSNSPFPWS